MKPDLLDRLASKAVTIKVGDEEIVLRCPSPEAYIDVIEFARTRDAESADGSYVMRLTAKCLAATVVTDRERTAEEWEQIVVGFQSNRATIDPELAKVPAAALSLCGYHTDIEEGEGVTGEIAEAEGELGPNPSESPPRLAEVSQRS